MNIKIPTVVISLILLLAALPAFSLDSCPAGPPVEKDIVLGCANQPKSTKLQFNGKKTCLMCLYAYQGCDKITKESDCYANLESGVYCEWRGKQCASLFEDDCDKQRNDAEPPPLDVYIKKPSPDWTIERLLSPDANPAISSCGPTTVVESRHGIGPKCMPQRVHAVFDRCAGKIDVTLASCSDGELDPELVSRLNILAKEFKMPGTPEIIVTANQCAASIGEHNGAPVVFHFSKEGCEVGLPECAKQYECVTSSPSSALVAYCNQNGRPTCMKCIPTVMPGEGTWKLLDNDSECRSKLAPLPAGLALRNGCFFSQDLKSSMTDFSCRGYCTCIAHRDTSDLTGYLKIWRAWVPGPEKTNSIQVAAFSRENAQSLFSDAWDIKGRDCDAICNTDAKVHAPDALKIEHRGSVIACDTAPNP